MIRLTDEGFTDDDELSTAFGGGLHLESGVLAPGQSLDEFTLQEREELVYRLLATMPRAQIAKVHRRIAPCVQVDIIGTLPSELALLVFTHLTWQSLLKCTLVSKRWRSIADDQSLWKNLCHSREWEWKWPSQPRELTLMAGPQEEEFHDEGMGDDEDADIEDEQFIVISEQDSGFSSTVPHDVGFGLPSTPRIGNHHRPLSKFSKAQTYRSNTRRSPSRPARQTHRHSAPSVLPSTEPARPDYKLLHQTHILLRNRLLHGTYRFSTLQTRGTPNSHASIIYCLQLYTYADGRQVLFTGSKDTTIREWNLSTGMVERVFEGVHTGSVLSLCAHGDYIASGGSDWRVCVWEIGSGRLVRTLMDHQDSVLCVRFNEKRLVSCSKDRTVRMYLFPDLDAHRVLGTHRAAVNAIAISGDLIVSASGDKSMRLWDATTGSMLRSFEGHHTRGIASIEFQPPYILSGSSDKHIRLFDMHTRRGWSSCAEFHKPAPATSSGICEACGGPFREQENGYDLVNPRGSITGSMQGFGTGNSAGAGGAGTTSRRTSIAREMHGDLVRSVAMGKEFVVTGSYDQSVKVWDRESGALVLDLTGGHDGRVFGVGFDCTKIVSCGEDQRICIWDLSYGIDTSFIKL